MRENLIENVFTGTCSRYERMLKNYYPSFGNTGFAERNITFNFCCAFLNYSRSENLIVWQEVPFRYENDSKHKRHFDSLIIDDQNRTLYLIEAKRLSETKKTDSISSDLDRMEEYLLSINFGEKEERKSYVKYLLILADIWIPVNERKKNKKKELADWFKDQLGKNSTPYNYSQEIKKDAQSLTEKEHYYLMCKAWEIKK